MAIVSKQNNNQYSLNLRVEPFFDLSLDLFCIIGLDGYLKKANSSFIKTFGYSDSELKARPFLSFIHPEDIETTLSELEKLKQDSISLEFENRYLCQDGSFRRLKWTVASVYCERDLIYAVVRDITSCYELRQKLFWQSKHDRLTGLLNRQEFEQQVIATIASTKIARQEHFFCHLDLDRFKVINDVCGHFVGDCLLQEITNLIKLEIKDGDILSRLGGDEFGLLLKNCSLEEATVITNKIKNAIKNFNFNWQDKNFILGVSIGVVAIDQNSTDFSHLLNAADIACYAAKEQGRNSVRVYHSEDRELARQRGERHWISRINLALEKNHFRLYCQKITPLQDRFGTDHYEILLRLVDSSGQLIPPIAFIPAAERYDLMPAIDRWVIGTFFASYQDHCQLSNLQGCGETIYTINLSGASINSDRFFTFLKEQFAIHEIPPEKICFEITETSAISNLEKAAKFIAELKELGCSFALDDFGSGMSSLAYLKTLPIDYLKIDGNFIKNIVNDPIDRATVECLNQIGKVMNIQTIAEFVENDDIVAELREIGINYAQGYGIERPTPLYF